MGAVVVGAAILVFTYAFASIPLPKDLTLDSSAEVFDLNGEPVGTFSGEERRFLIDTSRCSQDRKGPCIPDFIHDAVIAAEDRDFYDHNGVSLRGIARAAWANLTGGEIQQGGSTITQQYIKNAVLDDPSRTVSRKIKEAVLAIKLERRHSKEEILGFYLNTIYLGRGAYGIEAAARAYFDKHARNLTVQQAAYLAGIIPSPESYQPDENKFGARSRRNQVLDLMAEEGYISERKARRSKRGPVRLAKGIDTEDNIQPAAYFLEWIRVQLQDRFGRCLYTCGLRIHTTLDLEMQTEAENAISSILTEPEDPPAALVSMTPQGHVRALVGGKHVNSLRKSRQFNYATSYPGRQPGSAFKPFTLLSAIEEGISPDSRFPGPSQITIDDPACYTGTEPWDPENYGGSGYGYITLDQATTNSVNTVFAQLIAEIGPGSVADLVENFGFRGPPPKENEVPEVCSLALGGSIDVTPMEMARAYAGFSASGALPEVIGVRYVTDREGNCLVSFVDIKGTDCDDELANRIKPKQVVERNSADVLTQSLTHVVEEGTATAAAIGRPVAGKTGTTQDYENAWFAGYVPQLTTVVWMGYRAEKINGQLDTPQMTYCGDPALCRPVHGISVTGGSFPAQIWGTYMEQATAEMEIATFPVPRDEPDEIINSPDPTPTFVPEPEPEPTETEKDKKPSPKPEPQPTNTPNPQPTKPDPKPTKSPDPDPTPTPPDPTPTGGGPGGAGAVWILSRWALRDEVGRRRRPTDQELHE